MTGVLPPAAWRDDPALHRVLAALDGESGGSLPRAVGGGLITRAVGGAVRDTLAGLPVNDVDLATRLLPEDVLERLRAGGIKAVPTGIAHGTITAVADGRPFEVTTLRRDVATDGRRATIVYTDDWAEDAARRDFTINAIYADPISGALYDPVGGVADLAARRVRFIGDAAARIAEDHLRILRWFRFVARFGDGASENETLALISRSAPKLRALSRERIADELLRLLALADPQVTIRLMVDAGIFREMAPEVEGAASERLARLVRAEAAAALAADPIRRLIALLPPDARLADGVAARLKLSKRIRSRIAAALGPCAESAPRAIAYRLGREAAVDRALLAGDATLTLAALEGWAAPRMPVSGGLLVARGLAEGPGVTALLRQLEDQWVADDFPPHITLPPAAK